MESLADKYKTRVDVANTLAYYSMKLVTAVKSFYITGPIRTFSYIFHEMASMRKEAQSHKTVLPSFTTKLTIY